MGGGGSKSGSLDIADLANKYQIAPQDITAVMNVFQAVSNGKPQVDVGQFLTGLSRIREARPHLVIFSDDSARMVFSICDTDRSGKLNLTEILSALSVFMAGTEEQKAALVFKSISGSDSLLTEGDLRKHALRVVQLSAALALGDVNKAHPRGHPKHDALVDAMKTYEKKFADDIVRDAFAPYRNEQNATKFTMERWQSAAKSSNTVRCLLSPTLSTNVWRVAFGENGIQRCEFTRISDVLAHPKGFAHLFDIELQEIEKWGPPQKVQSLTLSSSPSAAAIVPPPVPSLVAPAATAEPNDSFEVIALPVRPHGNRITVMLTTVSGRQIPVECSTATTVWELKELVQAKEGIPQEHQRILWPQAQELVNTRSLSDYAVQDGQTLTLVVINRP